MSRSISRERVLWQIWEQQQLPTQLPLRDGRTVRVVFPGRPNTGSGPDFVGALLSFNDAALVRGDIEIHVASSSWFTHGHHKDPRYDDVLLHVVLTDDGPSAYTSADCLLPLLALGPILSAPASLPQSVQGPCSAAHAPKPDPAHVAIVQREAGLTRFTARMTHWEGELAGRTIEDCILHALLRAVGLGRNKAAYNALASALDGTTFESILEHNRRSCDVRTLAYALLLGMAGLLQQPTADPEMYALWEQYRDSWPALPLDARQWQLFRLRPVNRPEKRLLLVASLLSCYGLHGFLEEILDLLERDPRVPYTALISLLTPAGIGAGSSWALEAWANVFLPFAAAFGQRMQRVSLTEGATHHYLTLPGGGDNKQISWMLTLIGTKKPRLAIDQQGLLEIGERYCHHQWCDTCPLMAGSTSVHNEGHGVGETGLEPVTFRV